MPDQEEIERRERDREMFGEDEHYSLLSINVYDEEDIENDVPFDIVY